MRLSSRWLLLLAVPLALLLLAVILIPLLIDEQRLLAIAAEAARRETGAELRVEGDAALTILPRLAIDLEEVSLRDPGATEPLFSAQKLAITLRRWPLLAGEVVVDGVELGGLRLVIDSTEAEPAAAEDRAERDVDRGTAVAAAPLALQVARLSVTDSLVTLRQPGATRSVTINSLEAVDLNPAGRPMAVEADVAVQPTADADPIALRGSAALALNAEREELVLDAAQLEVVYPGMAPLRLQLSGKVNGAVEQADLVIALQQEQMRADGTLRYAGADSPQIDADLQVSTLDPLLLLLAGPEAGDAVAERESPEALPLAALRAVDSRVRLTVARSAYGAHTVTDLVLALRAVGGIVEVEQLAGAVHGGQFAVQGRLDARQESARINATGTLSGLDLAALQTALAIEGAPSGRLDAKASVTTGGATLPDLLAQIQADLELKVDGGDLKGGGTVRYAAQKSPQIDAKLIMNRFDPALLLLAGPEAAPPEEDAAASGELPLDALRRVDTRAELAIGEVIYGPHTLLNLRTSLRAVDGVARINTLTGQVHGGALDLKASLDATGDEATLWTRGTLTGVDLTRLLAAIEVDPALSGAADLDWKLNSRGNTPDAWVAGLSGPVTVATRDVVMHQLGVHKILCNAVSLVNQATVTAALPDETRFEALGMEAKLQQGVAQIEALQARIPYVVLAGTGRLDLVKQDFGADVAARLSPDIGKLDPACRVNPRLTAIDWPLRCSGNLAGEPAKWCRVDTEKIIEQLARGEAQRVIEKEAGKLLEKLLQR
jgi:uncharacterized protein involved in outer membrane biogenesis